MSEPVTLSAESIDAIARRVVEIQAESHIPSRPELTTLEAIRLTGRRSRSAFYRWAQARRVKPISPGYYRRAALLRALGATP